MKVSLNQIKNTDPRREHGDIGGLKASIADLGLINPLTVDQEGKLLAGRRRYQAVKELGWQEVECYVLPVDGDQLKAYRVAIQENSKRKQLTEVEEAAASKGYDDLMRKLEGSKSAGNPNLLKLNKLEGWTQTKTAQDLGISQPTISRQIKIATAIEEHPELAKLKSGQAVLGEYKRVKAKQEYQGAPAQGTLYKVYEGDFREVCKAFSPETIDCIITDPPYGEDYLPLYGSLAEMAARLLKPGGSLLVMTGTMFQPQVLNNMSQYLNYHWILAFVMGNGTSRVWATKVCQMWKPIIWLVKGEYKGDWVVDLLKSNEVEKDLEEWQQPVAPMEWLVERFSPPGGAILDPFMGTGTVGLAAIKKGCSFVGIDSDKEMVDIAKGRLALGQTMDRE